MKISESFYYFEDLFNATTSLLRPGFYGPTVVALKEFHCIIPRLTPVTVVSIARRIKLNLAITATLETEESARYGKVWPLWESRGVIWQFSLGRATCYLATFMLTLQLWDLFSPLRGPIVFQGKTKWENVYTCGLVLGCGDRGSWVHIPLNLINFVFLLQYIDDIFYFYNKAREIDKGVRYSF